MKSLNWWKTSSLAIKPGYFNTMLKLSGNPCTGKLLHCQEWKKSRMSKSKFKASLIIFSTLMASWWTEWLLESQTADQTYYLKVLATLWKGVRKKWPELWKNKSWILHPDNALARKTLSAKHYLATRGTTMLEHTSWSPHLAPCDFFLFPNIKTALKGIPFESKEEMKWKLAELLNALTRLPARLCQWKKLMEWRGEGV